MRYFMPSILILIAFVIVVSLVAFSIRRQLKKLPPESLGPDEHRAGWYVFLDGECIAELEYVEDDWPARVFCLHSKTDDRAKIQRALVTASHRDPDDSLEFRNKVYPLTVPDGPFIAVLQESGEVRLRDFRGP